jgi:DNA invertase Pin-like site-specific DNA recombinase
MSARAVVYVRTAQADAEQSVDSQLQACRAYARQHGYTVVAEFIDRGVSGVSAMDARPQGRAMLDALERGEAQVVIVDAIPRLSRDLSRLLGLMQRWQQAGVELHFADTGPVDLDLVAMMRQALAVG